MTKNLPTFEQKKEFLQDLDYTAVQACALYYFHNFKVESNDLDTFQVSVLNNALIESSLLFLRKINEFFGCRRTECRAKDFIPEYVPVYLFENIFDKRLIDNHVCHMTYENVIRGKINWAEFLTHYVPKAKDMFISFCKSLNKKEPDYFEGFIPLFLQRK